MFSPVAGFVLAGLLMFILKSRCRASRRCSKRRKATSRRRLLIRGLLIFTCTGVSFSHGSNDGQKGLGLIMLILIGTVPTAYALNGAVTGGQIAAFHSHQPGRGQRAERRRVRRDADGRWPPPPSKSLDRPPCRKKRCSRTLPAALAGMIGSIDQQVANRASLKDIPQNQVRNVRNDIYLTDAALTTVP